MLKLTLVIGANATGKTFLCAAPCIMRYQKKQLYITIQYDILRYRKKMTYHTRRERVEKW